MLFVAYTGLLLVFSIPFLVGCHSHSPPSCDCEVSSSLGTLPEPIASNSEGSVPEDNTESKAQSEPKQMKYNMLKTKSSSVSSSSSSSDDFVISKKKQKPNYTIVENEDGKMS